ncbi:MAG: aminotransferase class I/II-fold pyridoxal phosphate-dependent enzyme [Deltaproteobacteria bacterium]|nr:aminotransferase class I/II-fold pyridoxal phosphate-dependent enzyme [Deltaproteobacteria bacterium]
MALVSTVPRRCVNLPPGSLRTLISCVVTNKVEEGPAVDEFYREFGNWLGVPYVFGTSSGRSAFQLALESLGLEKGSEIIFPVLTFPVMPMVAKLLGFTPVFCEVDPVTFNSGPEHIEPKITERTGAILATHLFGQPCPIREIVELARPRKIRVMEDCAHACGVRVGGRQVGTFGDVGIFSFAEGKNMPCFGGGAIATADEGIAERARQNLLEAPGPKKAAAIKEAASIWAKWLVTRPFVFGLTVYPALRLKLMMGQSLMDSAVGNELLDEFVSTKPRITRLSNLQATMGLRQLQRIDRFNEGARRNAHRLTQKLGEVPGITAPSSTEGDHIYVYYPLTVAPDRRDDLRHYLLQQGIDSKTTDMADCSSLKPFLGTGNGGHRNGPSEASILEICVYPVIPENRMLDIARAIREWGGVEEQGSKEQSA